MTAPEINVWAALAEACQDAAPPDVWAQLQHRVGDGFTGQADQPEPGPPRCGRCGAACPECAAAVVKAAAADMAMVGYAVLPSESRPLAMDEHATRVALLALEPQDDENGPLHSRRPKRIRTSPVPRQGSGRA